MLTLDDRLADFGTIVIVLLALIPAGELLLAAAAEAKLLKLLLDWVEVLLDCKFCELVAFWEIAEVLANKLPELPVILARLDLK